MSSHDAPLLRLKSTNQASHQTSIRVLSTGGGHVVVSLRADGTIELGEGETAESALRHALEVLAKHARQR